MPARLRAVLFDVDHTLLDFDRAQARALREAFLDLGLPYAASTLPTYRRINDAIWAAYTRGEITQKALAKERFRRLLLATGGPSRVAGRLGKAFLDHLGRQGDRLPGCRPALRALGRTYRLGVVTNGIDRVQRSRLEVAGIAPLFEVIVTSAGSGYTKPDPRILHVALDAMGVPPRAALYVGDDPAIDGSAARAAGVRFCWMDPGRRRKGGRPRFRVTTLRELAARLA